MKGEQIFKGKTVLITGASSGIGSALAQAFARAGAITVLSARRTALLETLAEKIVAQGGPQPTVIAADLSVRGQALVLAQAALAQHRQIDILINNAGVGVSGAQLALGDTEAARAIFEINFWSPVALASALFDGKPARDFRAVVNVSSLIASAPLPQTGHYAASKSALSQATEALRLELLGTSVSVLHVLPGPVETPMLDELRNMNPDTRKMLSRIPSGRPEALASAILQALIRRQNELVFPRALGFVRHLPSLMRAINLKTTPPAATATTVGG